MTPLTVHTPDNGKTCIVARPGIAFFQIPAAKVPGLAADLRSFVQLSPEVPAARLGNAFLIVKTSEMLALADELESFHWQNTHAAGVAGSLLEDAK